MKRFLVAFGILVIVIGVYVGVRYISTMIHYACLNPVEDCPPPFRALADLGYYATGGSLVPVFDARFEPLQRAQLKQQ